MKILGTLLVLVLLVSAVAVWRWLHKSAAPESSGSGGPRAVVNSITRGDETTTGTGLSDAKIPDSRPTPRRLALVRLQALMEERDDYQVFVVIRENGQRGWRKVTQFRDGKLVLEEGNLDIGEVRGFVVGYPNGEVLDQFAAFSPLPGNLHFIPDGQRPRRDVLDPRTLVEGRKCVRIDFGPAVAHPNEPERYSTTLTNLTDEKIQVVRFGGYARRLWGPYRLSTISGDYFTAQEFREWYGVDADGWIRPGQSVTDGNNYGGGDGYWVYECIAESGTRFSAGARIPE